MKLSEAAEKGKNRYWVSAQVRRNPGAIDQWFVMLVNSESKQFMLASDDDDPIVSSDLNTFINLLGQLGIKEFTVFT